MLDPQRLFVDPDRFYRHVAVAQECVTAWDGALRIAFHFDDAYADAFLPALAATDLPGLDVAVFVPTAFAIEGRAFIWDRLRQAFVEPPLDRTLITDLMKAGDCVFEIAAQFMGVLSERARADVDVEHSINRVLDTHGRRPAPSDQAMSLDQLRMLATHGVAIGLHGHTHCSFAQLGHPNFASEIDQPFDCLHRIAGKPPAAFAFPFGSTADLNAEAVSHMPSWASIDSTQ